MFGFFEINCSVFLCVLSCRGWVEKGGSQKGGGQKGGGPEGWGPEGWGPTQKKWGPERWRAGKVEGRKGGGHKGGGHKGGARRVKISRFFSLSRRKFLFFFSLWGSSRGILVVFEAPGRSNVRVWSSRAVVCEPRRPGLVGPPGFHTTVREAKRAHLRVPVFKNTTKIQREDTHRVKKRTNFAAGEGKKERNFGRSRGRAVPGRAVPGRAVPGSAVPGAPNMTKPKP